jgi:hypothetical protein
VEPNDESLISKIPAFHSMLLVFDLGKELNGKLGIGFGSKGIVNIGVALP